jgi:hypothetical protein
VVMLVRGSLNEILRPFAPNMLSTHLPGFLTEDAAFRLVRHFGLLASSFHLPMVLRSARPDWPPLPRTPRIVVI